MNMRAQSRAVAVLGPTNTGKTHYAIERMLAHRTGVIGLPLRLLAREVYDRIRTLRGPDVVALITGEERIVPDRTQYWVCTVEAMPLEIGADFVAVDEIQLCADADRGHVFTDRLLHARGLHETLFMGSDTMRGAIAALVPGVFFQRRERLSQLGYAGSKKLSRMPARSAIVGFSVENVYAIAELIRRQKGGCAVVMGALSPRTRNAQVDLYQNGDVDYLVATDAIGMGLNLDIKHVAFSATRKFDGRRMRDLGADELAQIAGRAGRHMSAGTFGVTGEARPMSDDTIEAIESHRFAPVKKLQWRNAALEFGTAARLIASLERHATDDWLTRVRDAEDLLALKALTDDPEVASRLQGPQDVRLLWDVCRIPDFRGISPTEHAGLLARIYGFVHDSGRIPAEWLARNVARIDRTDGDIDALSRRLAFVRTWTYVAQRRGWVDDESHWRDATRAVEDRLSDALHARLTQRFVDRRTSVLMRRLKQKESLVAEVNDKGEVTVEGQLIGRMEGFRFRPDRTASPDEARTLRQAAQAVLVPHFHLRADRMYNAPDTEFELTEQGGLMWGTDAVGKLAAGADAMRPQAEAFVDDEAGPDVAEKVRRRLQHFIDRKVAALFEPLLAMSRDEALTGLARGFAFQMVEAMGIVPREKVAQDVRALDQDARGSLRKHGVRFGQFTVFLPLLLKPAPTRLRLVLASLHAGRSEFPESPPPGLVTIPNVAEVPPEDYLLAGYRPAGQRAIRVDMLERLADLLRPQDSRAGFEATPDMLSITGLTLEQFADLMAGLGYAAERGERVKQPAPEPAASAPTKPETDVPAHAASEADAPEAAKDTPEVATESAPDTTTSEGAPPAEAVAPEATVADAASTPAPESTGSEAEAVPVIAAEADSESAAPAGTPETPTEAVADPAAEMEVYFTFTWAPRPRRGAGRSDRRGDRSERGERPARGDKPAQADGARGAKPGKQGGKPRKDKPAGDRRSVPGKGKDQRPDRAATYSSGPRKSDRIDPDNPFAAALMGLRDKT